MEKENQNEELLEELDEIEMVELTDDEQKELEGGASIGRGYSEVRLGLYIKPLNNYFPAGTITITMKNGKSVRCSYKVGSRFVTAYSCSSTVPGVPGKVTVMLMYPGGDDLFIRVQNTVKEQSCFPKKLTFNYIGIDHVNHYYTKKIGCW